MLREHESLLTVADVAERFGQHPETIRRKARDGEIPALKLGTGPRARFAFDRTELEACVYGRPESAGVFAPFRARANPAERDDVPVSLLTKCDREVDAALALEVDGIIAHCEECQARTLVGLIFHADIDAMDEIPEDLLPFPWVVDSPEAVESSTDLSAPEPDSDD